MSANDEHRGPSDPGSYSVSCKHERMIALMRTGLERYNAEVARVAVERERQAKDAALQVSNARRRFLNVGKPRHNGCFRQTLRVPERTTQCRPPPTARIFVSRYLATCKTKSTPKQRPQPQGHLSRGISPPAKQHLTPEQLQAKVEIGKAQLANRRAREDAAARSLIRKVWRFHKIHVIAPPFEPPRSFRTQTGYMRFVRPVKSLRVGY